MQAHDVSRAQMHAVAVEEDGGFVRGEGERGPPDLAEPGLETEAGEAERRIGAGREHEVERGG